MYVCIRMYVCMFVCSMYVCTFVCMYVCTYVCKYRYTCQKKMKSTVLLSSKLAVLHSFYFHFQTSAFWILTRYTAIRCVCTTTTATVPSRPLCWPRPTAPVRACMCAVILDELQCISTFIALLLSIQKIRHFAYHVCHTWQIITVVVVAELIITFASHLK